MYVEFSSVDPNFYSKNLLMLGRTYLAMNDKQMAQFWLTKAKDYPAHTLEDKEVIAVMPFGVKKRRLKTN